MKQTLRYTGLIISNKLRCEIRVSFEEGKVEFTYDSPNGDKNVALGLYPLIVLSIIRPYETDDNGRRVKAKYNPNDSLGMNKYSLPIFIEELVKMRKNLEQEGLYSYQGNRLEINESIAEKIRSPFKIGILTVELSAAVIIQPDESRVEGIKLKIMNESSVVNLTVTELNSLIFNLKNIDVDSIALLLYLRYMLSKGKDMEIVSTQSMNSSDILPKERDLDREFE